MKDADIRSSLKVLKLERFFQDPNSKVVDEFQICQGDSRIDIAVINGSLNGYEIKSERDTLERLPSQLSHYAKVFDYLTIVCGENHLEGIKDLAPEFCGILVSKKHKRTNQIYFREIQRPRKNYKVEKLELARLLWKDESINLLNSIGIVKGIRSKPRSFLWNLLADNFSVSQLNIAVRSNLKARINWRVD